MINSEVFASVLSQVIVIYKNLGQNSFPKCAIHYVMNSNIEVLISKYYICIYLYRLIQTKPQQQFKITNIKEFFNTEKQATFPHNECIYKCSLTEFVVPN